MKKQNENSKRFYINKELEFLADFKRMKLEYNNCSEVDYKNSNYYWYFKFKIKDNKIYWSANKRISEWQIFNWDLDHDLPEKLLKAYKEYLFDKEIKKLLED